MAPTRTIVKSRSTVRRYKKSTGRTYRKSRSRYTRRRRTSGLRQWKRIQRKPKTSLRIFRMQIKGMKTLFMEYDSEGTPKIEYGVQFRRFGQATESPAISNTVGIGSNSNFFKISQQFEEVAFMGMKVHACYLQRQNQMLQAPVEQGQVVDVAPIMINNNTWYDTDTVQNAQDYNPGFTVSLANQINRNTLQRHKPLGNWKKYVNNRYYAKKERLDWFKVKDFYNGTVMTNPAGIPDPMLRTYFSYTPNTTKYPEGTPLVTYYYTYYVMFRGYKNLNVELPVDVADVSQKRDETGQIIS